MNEIKYAVSEDLISISTRQASDLLGVHESSVKRWCNADDLGCWYTPGGHRRIPISSLVAFAQEQDIQLPLRHFGDDASRVWQGIQQAQRNDDFGELTGLTYSWIEQGWSHQSTRLIEYLVQEGMNLGQIFDRIVGPVMYQIGMGYLEGDLSIGDEHRMTQAVRDVLIDLRTAVHPVESFNGQTESIAIVGCARGEVHELGALMVRLLLESKGWRVIYLGLNVPTEEFAAQQVKYNATLVCVSMMPPMGMTEAQTMVQLLNRMYDPERPYHLALGGTALGEVKALNLADIAILVIDVNEGLKPQTIEAIEKVSEICDKLSPGC